MTMNLKEFNNYMEEKIKENQNNKNQIAIDKINNNLKELNDKKMQSTNLLNKALKEFDISNAAKQKNIIADIDGNIATNKELLLEMSTMECRINNYYELCEEIEEYYKPIIKEDTQEIVNKYNDLCRAIEQLDEDNKMKEDIAGILYNSGDGENDKYPLNISLDKETLNKILDNSIGSLRRCIKNMAEKFE